MALSVKLLTSEKVIFEGQAKSISVPGEEGFFEVLVFHKPLISRLISGLINIDHRTFRILRGVIKVYKNDVTIIAEEA